MKFRNLILLVGTIGIAKALDGNETLVSTSGLIGKGIANETSVAEASPSQPVDSANRCISTLTLSTCTCEPKGSQSINTSGGTPIYEGDEWDRYVEMPKATSTTLSPDCVLRTNFSTNSLHHGRPTHRNVKWSSASTHSSHLANQTTTNSISSNYGVLSLTFPSIHISSTRAHYYNTLTLVHQDANAHTGYHNSSISTGYSNISSTIESASLSSHISTEEYTTTEDFSTSEILITTVAETETPAALTLSLHFDISTSQSSSPSIAGPENPTTYASETEETSTPNTEINESLAPSLTFQNDVTSTVDFYPISTAETTQAYETEDQKTIQETTHESSESSVASSLETSITMESSLIEHQHSSASHNIKTSQTSLISNPTTQPENNWSDYWSDENWSEEWPSEFWSDVFKETSKTMNPTYSTTRSKSEKHSTLPSIKTYTHTGRKSHNEHQSTSRVQPFVSSTHTTEGSFRILPTPHMPKQTSHSAEHTSHGHHIEETHSERQHTEVHHTKEHHTEEHHTEEHHTEEHHTEEHHTEEHHTERQHTEEPQHHTEEHHTEEHRTEEYSTEVQHTKEHYTEEHSTELHHSEETTEHPSPSLTSSISVSSEPIHRTSESKYYPTSRSKEAVHLSSTSISPQLSQEEHSSYTSKHTPKVSSRTPISTGPLMSTSIHPASKVSPGSSHHPKTTNYSKRSKLTGTGSISAEFTTTHPSFSRTYPRKKSYAPIFTLKPAPSMLSLGNSRQAKPLFQTSSEETETETETLYITILSSTEKPKSTIQSSHLEQPSSSKSSTVSANESISSTLARPYHILKPNEETESTSSESNASKTTIYYLLFVPCFILLVLV
ncbi:uncharacterized protein AC631_01004 [Debaryomyces fabryi]|uniref:Flo11 domain-containing protein n=1 Tax=Debaryomyces fabryi TaxID=58627 RepID=A0A0V1Q3X5_9ASCO|nr:uncharacterized protein AC631_01004 [Debaryomyces fabryi]KSA03230.1 hypothetical protein AC631_01004 [Debaryomyces fabryi]